MSKPLECIICDKLFELGDLFLAHFNADDIVDCSQCLKCVDRLGAIDVKEKVGGWGVLERKFKGDSLIYELLS